LGLEDWEGLLRRFGEQLEFGYEYYRSRASGEKPKIASLIAQDFHELWFQSQEYRQSRLKFKGQIKNILSPLKLEISNYLDTLLNDLYRFHLEEIKVLERGINVDGIITTNWDCLLEKLFPKYKAFKTQDDLISSTPQGIGEIHKIHGCITDPDIAERLYS